MSLKLDTILVSKSSLVMSETEPTTSLTETGNFEDITTTSSTFSSISCPLRYVINDEANKKKLNNFIKFFIIYCK